MKVIYNNILPFGRYTAINLFGVVFAKKAHGPLSSTIIRHEKIHTMQQVEMLFVGFYIAYLLEWLYHLIHTGNAHKAYLRISFEREAYAMENDPLYQRTRRPYAWTGFLLSK